STAADAPRVPTVADPLLALPPARSRRAARAWLFRDSFSRRVVCAQPLALFVGTAAALVALRAHPNGEPRVVLFLLGRACMGLAVTLLQPHPLRVAGLVPYAALGLAAALVWSALGGGSDACLAAIGACGAAVLGPLRSALPGVTPGPLRAAANAWQ